MILITGGTGTAGREISKALEHMGARHRSLVRDRTKAAASASSNVDLVQGDLSRPETLAAALDGVEKALLLTAASPEAVQQERNFIAAAKRAGVRYVVKFSSYGAGLHAPHFFGRQHGEGERRLEDSGLPFTMLRPNGFFQNFLGNAGSIQARSAFHAPAGAMKFSAVDVRDFGAVAGLAVLWAGMAMARDPEAPLRIPLEPLGSQAITPEFLLAGDSELTVDFVDNDHLLVTFGVRRLMKREADSLPKDDDQTIAALLVELPAGKVLARTEWRMHDRLQYLWNLGHGRFLLRVRDRLTVIAPLAAADKNDAFRESPLLRVERHVVAILVSSDSDLLTVYTVKQPAGAG